MSLVMSEKSGLALMVWGTVGAEVTPLKGKAFHACP